MLRNESATVVYTLDLGVGNAADECKQQPAPPGRGHAAFELTARKLAHALKPAGSSMAVDERVVASSRGKSPLTVALCAPERPVRYQEACRKGMRSLSSDAV